MKNIDAPPRRRSGEKTFSPSAWILICGIALYALVRGILLFNPGYEDDVVQYKAWAVQAARFGIAQIYRCSTMDYPPLYGYILDPLGQLYLWLTPGAMEYPRDTTLLTVLVKLPPLLFDVGIGALLFRWTRRRKATWIAWLVAAAYLVNPAVLFDDAYWGQPDSIHSFFLLAAFMALGYGTRFGQSERSRQQLFDGARAIVPAWMLFTLANAMKPQAAPLLPLLIALSLMLYGVGPTAVGIGAAAATALAVCIPFVAHGGAIALFHRVVGDVVGAMPFTSANAHNVWWVFGPWRNAEIAWLGPFTATQISLFLFGVAYSALLWRTYTLYRAQAEFVWPSQVIALAALVGFSFFILSTHMHENHMFAVIALLAPLISQDRIWRRVFIAASFAVFANLALHDLVIPDRWPLTVGGFSHTENPQLGHPFYVTALTGIWISTAFNLSLYVLAMIGALKRNGWLTRLGASSSEVDSPPEALRV